jgi:hypothetical protein
MNVSRNHADDVARSNMRTTQRGGTLLPRLCSPLFSPVEGSKRPQPGVERASAEERWIVAMRGPASA